MKTRASGDMRSRCRRVEAICLLAGLGASLAAACGGSAGSRTIVGGESHFLSHCDGDASCGGGLACIGGVCTLDCSAAEVSCGALSPLASCAFQGSEPDALAVCDVGCSEDAACTPLGAAHRCESGVCRAPGAIPSSDSALGVDLSVPVIGETFEPAPDPAGEETSAGSSPVQSLCANQPVLDVAAPEGGWWIVQTQAEVDALEGCEEIPFDLVISSEANVFLDLRPLHALTVVRGVLEIQGVPSLEGLEQLRTAASLGLYRIGASSLRSLANLQSLDPALGGDYFAGFLMIVGCDRLEELDGLGSLSFQSLHIERNANLRSLSPLQPPLGMKRVVISDTPALLDLGALALLESVVTLQVYGNQALEQLDLNALRSIGASETVDPEPGILVALNPQLQKVGLGALTAAPSVVIQRNQSLASVDLGALSEASRLVVGLNLALPPSAITMNENLSADVLRVGGNGSGTSTTLSPWPTEPFLDPCPWGDDGHCDFCQASILPTGGTLGRICPAALCITDSPLDCP